jgi:hypothetical protein
MRFLQAIRAWKWWPALRLVLLVLLSVFAGCVLTGIGAAPLFGDHFACPPISVVLLYPAFIDAFGLDAFPRNPVAALVLTAVFWSVVVFLSLSFLMWRHGSLLRRVLLLLVVLVMSIAWELQPGQIEGCWNLRPSHPCLCEELKFLRFDGGRIHWFHGRGPALYAGQYDEIQSGVYRIEWKGVGEATLHVFRHIAYCTCVDLEGIALYPRLRNTEEAEDILDIGMSKPVGVK